MRSFTIWHGCKIRRCRRRFWPRPTWSIGTMPTCGRWPGIWPAARTMRSRLRGGVSSGSATRFGTASTAATRSSPARLGSARAADGLLLCEEPSARGAAACQRHPGRLLLSAAVDRWRGPAILFARFQRRAAAGPWLVPHGRARQQARRRRSIHAADISQLVERLAFPIQFPGEATFPEIHAEPLAWSSTCCARHSTVAEVVANLPDWLPRLGSQGCGPASPWPSRSEKARMLAEKTFRFRAGKPPLTRFWPRPYSPPPTTNDTWEASRGKSSWPSNRLLLKCLHESRAGTNRQSLEEGQNEPRGTGRRLPRLEAVANPLSGWRWHGSPPSATIHSPTHGSRPPPYAT